MLPLREVATKDREAPETVATAEKRAQPHCRKANNKEAVVVVAVVKVVVEEEVVDGAVVVVDGVAAVMVMKTAAGGVVAGAGGVASVAVEGGIVGDVEVDEVSVGVELGAHRLMSAPWALRSMVYQRRR